MLRSVSRRVTAPASLALSTGGRLGGWLLVAALASGCSTRSFLTERLADELAAPPAVAEDDLQLAREASAFHLKLSESVLRQTPGHIGLAGAVAGGYTQYAYAFVAFDADRIEARDAAAAQALRERAARLYRRAHRHAMTALEAATPGFAQALASPDPARWPVIRPAQVALAYWAAASWGGAISLSKDDPDAVADLPLAVRLATLAYAVEPDHGQGALASLMGSFEAARAGGSRARADAYFDRAIAAGGPTQAGPRVAKAETLALPAGDRAAFVALLGQARAIAVAHRDVGNEAMRERADWLLGQVDDLF
ncbi:TRAP transporter TatT component family protein [Leptothrix discophora]|uniref:TRAP transporter TatT component family protein n=1 Tax=Leptothrix discophora TaxID=89 RepID=A0ABT9G8U7_LEPDI|nr:TRAP transporter TatT component family protein [Leptothrix discophora]MDP4302846.1 TRAP transporter TatT component family protein [Leptothrix discophora]